MPGQTWATAEASFLAMWIAMTAAMMLPSVAPTLWRWRQSVAGAGAWHPALLTSLVGAGYVFVWTVVGAAVFPLGVALATVRMRQPALAHLAPVAVGAVVLIAGLLQRTAWKARHLACCRERHWHGVSRAVAGAAWKQGVRLGIHCCCSCAAPMAILLALGLMDLRAMVVVAGAVTAERLAPTGACVARLTGTVAVAAGVLLIVHAASALRG